MLSLLWDPASYWEDKDIFFRPGEKNAVGYLCPYLPEEILHAAGLIPVRIMPVSGSLHAADRHLPANSCTLAKSLLSQAHDGSLDFLKGIFFAHTCDTMQCLADIYSVNYPGFVYHLVGPTALAATGAREYLEAELAALLKFLQERLQHTVTEDKLWESILLYNYHRLLLKQLEETREHYSSHTYFSLLRAGMLLPKELFNTLLPQAMQSLSGRPGAGTRLLLAGAVLHDLSLTGLIDELGAKVVADTLCCGARYFDTPASVDKHRRPLTVLAERYLSRVPCPAKHDGSDLISKHLLRLVKTRNAQGVVFLLDPFCDPHSFEYVAQARALAASGIPHLSLQIDHHGISGQTGTRLQAFLEMLQGGEKSEQPKVS